MRIQRRNNLILGAVMVGLLVLSSVGYAVMSATGGSSGKVEELGFEFFEYGGYWATAVGGSTFYFEFLPSEVASVDVNLSLGLEDYYDEVLYFVNSGVDSSEVLMNLGDFVLRYQNACLGDEIEVENETYVVSSGECDGDYPVKSCSSNLIVFEDGDESVYQDEGCVFVVGGMKSTDAFLYRVLGIM